MGEALATLNTQQHTPPYPADHQDASGSLPQGGVYQGGPPPSLDDEATTILAFAAQGGDPEVIQLVNAAGATEGTGFALALAGSEAAFSAILPLCTAELADPAKSYAILNFAMRNNCWTNAQRLLSLGVSPACLPDYYVPRPRPGCDAGEPEDNEVVSSTYLTPLGCALSNCCTDDKYLEVPCPLDLVVQILGHDAIKAQIAARSVPSPPLYGFGSIIHYAYLTRVKSVEALQALLAAGFNPLDASPFTGATCCHYLYYSKLAAAIATAAPAVLHIKDAEDATPLHRLTGGGYVGCIYGGISKRDWDDESSEVRATFALFLKLGADGELEDGNGRKAAVPRFGNYEEEC